MAQSVPWPQIVTERHMTTDTRPKPECTVPPALILDFNRCQELYWLEHSELANYRSRAASWASLPMGRLFDKTHIQSRWITGHVLPAERHCRWAACLTKHTFRAGELQVTCCQLSVTANGQLVWQNTHSELVNYRSRAASWASLPMGRLFDKTHIAVETWEHRKASLWK